MSDIHVLTTPEQNDKRSVTALYHVPVDQDNYPGDQTSQIESELGQTEIDKLQNGSLREVSHSFRFESGTAVDEMKAAVRDHWHDVAAEEQARIDTEYEYYLTPLNRS